MISCTEFIPAYSELFRFLEKKGGYQAVVRFWESLSDSYLKKTLKALVKKHGIRGCWLYWNKSLNEEAADFTMELDEEAGEFQIKMHRCPSKGMLNRIKHYKPYPKYCEHCDVLYRRVLEPMGFECITDLTQCDKARCSFLLRLRNPAQAGLGKVRKAPSRARRKAPAKKAPAKAR